MWIAEGIIVGILAGIFMGIASEIGYRLGVIKSHLVVIDGSFTLRLLRKESGKAAVYVLGTIMHLVTSMVFGIIYIIIARLAGFEARLSLAVAIYVLLLWLAMLSLALPVAGHGFMGNKIGRFVWAEQLVLHIVFGVGFWWALGLM